MSQLHLPNSTSVVSGIDAIKRLNRDSKRVYTFCRWFCYRRGGTVVVEIAFLSDGSAPDAIKRKHTHTHTCEMDAAALAAAV
jgi:hypothetical protein